MSETLLFLAVMHVLAFKECGILQLVIVCVANSTIQSAVVPHFHDMLKGTAGCVTQDGRGVVCYAHSDYVLFYGPTSGRL